MTDFSLTNSEWGRRFIQSLQEEIDNMYFMESPKGGCWAKDDCQWFAPCYKIIEDGAKAGDPALMYLAAEVAVRYGDPMDLYIQSADKGYPLSILWTAFCYEKGYFGFPEDANKTDEMLKKLAAFPQCLSFPELSFLQETVEELENMAYRADFEEDAVGDRHGFKGNYEDELPDPTWRTLHLRKIELMEFMISIGLPFELEPRGYEYKWPNSFADDAYYLKVYKQEWAQWCADHGINIPLWKDDKS